MQGSDVGAPDPGTAAPTRTAARDAVGGIAAAVVLGLALRLIIAYLLPGSGFGVDLNAFRFWAANLASQGLSGFYGRDFFHDYTPGYLYVLWIVGLIGKVAGGVGDLVKVPPILADIALAWLVASMVRELGGGTRAARLAAFVVALNPVTWFDSVVWGQVDSVGVVVLLLALRELWRDRPERSAVLAMLAALIKPQLGILIPIVAVVTIRRALARDGGFGDDPEPPAPAGTLGWERTTRGPVRILTTGLAGILTAVALSLPFGLSLSGLLSQVFSAAGGYPYVSVNAFNLWALVSKDGSGVAANGRWVCDTTAVPAPGGAIDIGGFELFRWPPTSITCDGAMIGAIPAVLVGTALFLLVLAVVLAVVWRRPDRRTLLVALAVLAIAFFAVPTRVHERYLFPFMAIGAILAAVSRPWRWVYAASALAMLANLYAVLVNPFYANPGIADWLGIEGALTSYAGVATVAIVQTAVLLWAATRLRDDALDDLADEIDDGAEADGLLAWDDEVASGAPGDAVPALAPAAPTASAPFLPSDEPPDGGAPPDGEAPPARRARLVPAWAIRTPSSEAGPVEWIRERLSERSIRADRSRELDREPGGRLDRLDVWVLLVLAAALLTTRIWRLAEPYDMHFDEVYHARTATEFLQDWRYGISHDIYEWTHPHLAKYAMALGIVAFGDDLVSATSSLGVTVRDAAIEPRFDQSTTAYGRLGDRLWVVTDGGVRAYDLATRALVAEVPIADASAVAVDVTNHVVYVGTTGGSIETIDTGPLDDARDGGTGTAVARPWMRDLGPVRMLLAPEATQWLFAVATTSPAGGGPTSDTVTALDTGAASAAGSVSLTGVTGMTWTSRNLLAIAESRGVSFLDPKGQTNLAPLPLDGPTGGIARTSALTDDPVYVSYLAADGPRLAEVTGLGSSGDQAPRVGRTAVLPGSTAGAVRFDPATRMVHVLGSVPDGATPTEYVVEPHALAVYADAPLPFAPTALVVDDQIKYPSVDRRQLLAFAADGSVASVEIGRNAWAWRLPGVFAGVGMALLLYVLARLLFRRRSVAVLTGFLMLADGLMFAQSRIGMNDTYVGFFIVAAYTLFAALWLRGGGTRRRWLAFALGMPVVGILLGLALASKWVAAYAIGGLGILVLTRSALGRLVLVAGMVVATTVLGYLAISVPEGTGGGNFLFLAIMVALTLVAAVANVLHPLAWTWEEQRLGYAAPLAVAAAAGLGGLATGTLSTTFAVGPIAATPLEVAFAGVLGAVAVHAAFVVAGRMGFGPMAVAPRAGSAAALVPPPDPAPAGWLNLGSFVGIPAVWALVCVVAIPVAVYVLSYVPWALVENHQLVPGWPAGHTGQTLVALTGQMYAYHNNLTQPHPASSPWWAWTLDMKPVWFYQQGFAGGTMGAIYNAGNLVAWWFGIPAMAFAAFQAFRRKHAGLALVAIAFACQWIAWARIDRAAFEYHYYTSIPFVFIAVAYLVAELWHGPSRRTWALAKVSAAVMVLGPMILWTLDRPLCGLVRVEDVNPGSQACPALIPDLAVTPRAVAMAIVVGVGAILLVRMLLGTGDGGSGEDGSDGGADGGRGLLGRLGGAVVVAAVVSVAFAAVSALLPSDAVFHLRDIPVEPISITLLFAFAPIAGWILSARDPRRFVAGLIGAIGFWFVLWYPNVSALPMPAAFSNTYQGLLPTYLYPFQFSVNTADRSGPGPALIAPGPAILLVAVAIVTLAFAYSARSWRLALAQESAGDERATGAPAPDAEPPDAEPPGR